MPKGWPMPSCAPNFSFGTSCRGQPSWERRTSKCSEEVPPLLNMMVVFVLFVFSLILGSPHGFQVLDQTQGGESGGGVVRSTT